MQNYFYYGLRVVRKRGGNSFPTHTLVVHIVEEILCQTRRRVRSLLDVNEELAHRSAVQNLPARCTTKCPVFLQEIAIYNGYK